MTLRRACKFADYNCYNQMLSHYLSLEGNQRLLSFLAKHAPSGMKSKAMVQLNLENVSPLILGDTHSTAPCPATSGTGNIEAIVNTPSAQESSTSGNAQPTDVLPPTSQTSNGDSPTEEDTQATVPCSATCGEGSVGMVASTPSTSASLPTKSVTSATASNGETIASTAEEDTQATVPCSATCGEGSVGTIASSPSTATSLPTKPVTSMTATTSALRKDKPPMVKRKRKTIDDEEFVDLDTKSRGKPKQVKRSSNRKRTDENEESYVVEAIVDFKQKPGVRILWHQINS